MLRVDWNALLTFASPRRAADIPATVQRRGQILDIFYAQTTFIVTGWSRARQYSHCRRFGSWISFEQGHLFRCLRKARRWRARSWKYVIATLRLLTHNLVKILRRCSCGSTTGWKLTRLLFHRFLERNDLAWLHILDISPLVYEWFLAFEASLERHELLFSINGWIIIYRMVYQNSSNFSW